MKRLHFLRMLRGLVWLATGCAESAIPREDQEEGASLGEPTGEVDATRSDAEVTLVSDGNAGADTETRDGSGGDAARAADSAGGRDASRPSAGATVRDAAVRDGAVLDTGTPAAADSGTLPVACSNGQTNCGNTCVDTTSDEANCGGCGSACAADQTCRDNICTGSSPTVGVPIGCTSRTLGAHRYAFCTNNLSWIDARRACLEAKLDLLIIGDAAENDFARGNGESWIAANDRMDESQWLSVVPGNANRANGAPVTFNNWQLGEPNNSAQCDGLPLLGVCLGQRSEEDCGMLAADGSWNDADCGQRRGFVCESY
jgi:Lectin C-type domain/Stigma-specific protein, Stig1